jgi:hypothetical protein
MAAIGQGEKIVHMIQVQMAEQHSVDRLQASSHLIQAQEGACTAIEEEGQIVLYQYCCLGTPRLGDADACAEESYLEAHHITLSEFVTLSALFTHYNI